VTDKATRADKAWINRNLGKWTPSKVKPAKLPPADDVVFDIDLGTPKLKQS
jgi:hypothetical protein